MLNVINPYGFDSSILPYRVDIIGWSAADSVSGMTFTRVQNNAELGGGVASQASAADSDNNDYMQWNFLVESGTYRLDLIHTKWASYAIFDILIDGVSVGTVDGYNASILHNVVTSITGIVLTAGHHTVRIAANGKNASSTNYTITTQSVTLTRTGA